MKQIHWIILSAAALLGIAACTHTEEPMEAALKDASTTTRVVIREILEVQTDTVGTLAEKIGDERGTVQKLIISGPIDATDVQTFRDLPTLLAIDLKEATICGGDSTYTSYASRKFKLYDNVIGQYMFYDTNLSEIVLPDNITEIDAHAFYELQGPSDDNRFESIVIPEGVEIIREEAFFDCYYLEEVTLPSTLKEIEYRSFYRCENLETIDLGGVETIGNNAFQGCTSLRSITLPETLKDLGTGCFQSSGLRSIDIPENITDYASNLFRYCTSLQTVTLPDNAEGVWSYMFEGCTSLNNVVVPESVRYIYAGAFIGCTSLSNITLPQQLESITESAFEGCTSLTHIELPASLSLIHDRAFYDTGLTSIVIPENVTSIGEQSFSYCNDLTSVTLNEQITTLPSYAFSYCDALEEITLPESITTIEDYCFLSCTSLNNIQWSTNLKSIGNSAFLNTGLTQVMLPEQLESIDNSAFSECNNLTSITIPSSVKTVNTFIFYRCYNLTSIFWNTSINVPQYICGGFSSDMNSNVILYLADGSTQVETNLINNIVIDGVANEIRLYSASNSPFFVPQEFRAAHVTYTRSFTYPTYPGEASGWRSISLPFTVDNITGPAGQTLAPFNADVADAKPFWLRRLTENGFENVTQIEAGVPYIIAMPNNEAYDDEYNISGTVTFTASSSAGILFPDSVEMTQDVGPAFTFNANYSYLPQGTSIYALNEENTDSYAGSRFVRNERDVLPFEGYVSNSVITSNAPRYYDIDAGRPATRAARPLGPVPSIDDM